MQIWGPFLTFMAAPLTSLTYAGKQRPDHRPASRAKTRDAAQALKGLNLFIPRSRLPELQDEEFYVEDLKGLSVFENNQKIGFVKSVRDHGAGDLVEIEFLNKKTDYFSFTLANFPEIDLGNKRLTFNRPAEIISQDEQGQVH